MKMGTFYKIFVLIKAIMISIVKKKMYSSLEILRVAEKV